MKRVLVIICLIVMILSLVACDYIFGTNNNNGATNNNKIDNIIYIKEIHILALKIQKHYLMKPMFIIFAFAEKMAKA